MKMTKKKVFASALAVCLIAILSFGTLAWFNATDTVTNTFKIADSDGEGTPDFKVDVYETDPVTKEKNQDGITYEHIAPGDKLAKDPHVYNMGDYDQWIRVYVTFDEWTTIKEACANQNISDDLRKWLSINDAEWTADEKIIYGEDNTITYVYYLNRKLTAGSDAVVLFKDVTIPGEFEQKDMKFADRDFSITIKAEALQADNTGDNAKDAFAAYWSY